MSHTPVLIIGGSLVGLSASLFLSWRGVANVVVDKHPGSAAHPRAIGFTETSLEHYRAVGIGDRIPQSPPDTRLRRVTVESLVQEWKSEQHWTPGEEADRSTGLSPCLGAAIAQDKLEPILREEALARGSELRLSTEMLSFQQTDEKVVVRLRDCRNGEESEISADYVIAADGASSQIRETLGITRQGIGHLMVMRSVLFLCPDADQYLAAGAKQFSLEQPGGFKAFLTTYSDSRWVLMTYGDQERDHDEWRAVIRQALGRDMPFEIITTGRWEMAGRVATSYRSGRIFLAGDAAHQLPPTRGGFGANTGIDDAWNLAWKLDRVIKGQSAPSLLDTYDSERRPIGWLRHQQTFSRPDYAKWTAGKTFKADALFSNDAMEFGQLVRSAAVVGAALELPAAASPKHWAGQPGTRAPHVTLTTAAGESISSIDLFGSSFVLLAGSAAWQPAADSLHLRMITVGSDVRFPADALFAAVFGVDSTGAVLVRPDGIIAWRSTGPVDVDAADAELRSVFERVSAAPRLSRDAAGVDRASSGSLKFL